MAATFTGIIAAAGGLLATPAQAANTGGVYVALGDSFASGPLITPIADLGCSRSGVNYAHLLATRLAVTKFTDVTCDSATTDNMTQVQHRNPGGITYSDAPPQFNALTADTTLVTITIGGGDTGLVGVADDCINLLPAALGAVSCQPQFVTNGVDSVESSITAFGVKLATVLDQIHAKSPKAKVVATGYGLYLRKNGCYPTVPMLPTDANYLQAKVDSLNSTIKAVAAAHNATYIDLRTPGAGHDACAAAADQWLEGVVPTSSAFPLHPSQAGEAAFAKIIGDYLVAN